MKKPVTGKKPAARRGRRVNVVRTLLVLCAVLAALLLLSGLLVRLAFIRYSSPREIEKLAAYYLPGYRLSLETFRIDLLGNLVAEGVKVKFPDGTPLVNIRKVALWLNPVKAWSIARGHEAAFPDTVALSGATLYLSKKLGEKPPEPPAPPPQQAPPGSPGAPAPEPPAAAKPLFGNSLVTLKNIEIMKYVNKTSSFPLVRNLGGWMRTSKFGTIDFSLGADGVKGGELSLKGSWLHEPSTVDGTITFAKLTVGDVEPFLPSGAKFPFAGALRGSVRLKGLFPLPAVDGVVETDGATSGGISLGAARLSIALTGPAESPAADLRLECRAGTAGATSFEGLTLAVTGKKTGKSSRIEGSVELRRLSWKELAVTGLRLPVRIDGETVTVGRSSFVFLGDTIEVQAKGSLGGKSPSFSALVDFKVIDLADKALASFRLPVTGRAAGSVRVNLSGGKLSSSGVVSLREGRMEAVPGAVGFRLPFIYGNGVLALSGGSISLPWGAVTLSGSLSPGGRIAVRVQSGALDVKLKEPPLVLSGARIGASARGTLTALAIDVRGQAAALETQGIRLKNVQLRLDLLKEEKSIRIRPSVIHLGSSPVRLSGSVELEGDRAMRLRLSATLSALAPLLGPGISGMKGDAALSVVSVAGRDTLDGEVELRNLYVQGERFDKGSVKVSRKGKRLDFTGGVAKNGGTIAVKGRMEDPRMSIDFASSTLSTAQIPFREKFFPLLEAKLKFSGAVTGTQKSPFIKAQVSLSDCRYDRRRITGLTGSSSGTLKEMKVPSIRLTDASPPIVFTGSIYPEKETLHLAAPVRGNSFSALASMFGYGLPEGLRGSFHGTVSLSGKFVDIEAGLEGKVKDVSYAGQRLGEGEMRLKSTQQRIDGVIYLSGSAVSLTLPKGLPGFHMRPLIRLSGNPRSPTATLDFERGQGESPAPGSPGKTEPAKPPGKIETPKLPDRIELPKLPDKIELPKLPDLKDIFKPKP